MVFKNIIHEKSVFFCRRMRTKNALLSNQLIYVHFDCFSRFSSRGIKNVFRIFMYSYFICLMFWPDILVDGWEKNSLIGWLCLWRKIDRNWEFCLNLHYPKKTKKKQTKKRQNRNNTERIRHTENKNVSRKP